MTEPLFTVSREDWSLHRKGYQDQTRHQEKVKEAIKQNLPDLVTDESIVMSNGKQVVKVPIKSLDEYRFRYNFNKGKHVGQGDGDSQVGDVLGTDPQPAQDQGKAKVRAIKRAKTIMRPKSAWRSCKRCCSLSWSCRIYRKRETQHDDHRSDFQ